MGEVLESKNGRGIREVQGCRNNYPSSFFPVLRQIFVVETKASSFELGPVLAHKKEDVLICPI